MFFLLGLAWLAGGETIFETTSPYHHILVVDEAGLRTLSFDGSMETQMSLANPLQGHFEYTEYFQMAWLWNNRMSNVLMIGLGGASTQRAFQHYYPDVTVVTVELDPMVHRVAKEFFHFQESPRQQVHLEDGRVFLRRTRQRFDSIILDAYTTTRYGSYIPYHLATREFFALASERLATNGVLAYNVIGEVLGFRADIVGAVYRTMKAVFPQVYLFPARQSGNVVILGTKSADKVTLRQLQTRAVLLLQEKRVTLPSFNSRLASFRAAPPLNANRSPVLNDDYAPVDGLLTSGNNGGSRPPLQR